MHLIQLYAKWARQRVKMLVKQMETSQRSPGKRIQMQRAAPWTHVPSWRTSSRRRLRPRWDTNINKPESAALYHGFFVRLTGATGQLGATDLRLRGLVFGGHATVREHHTRLGAVSDLQQGHQLEGRQAESQVQGGRAIILQVQHYLHGNMQS